MSTTALMQLGRAEFARICDGKAPSLDSVLTLGQYVMGQLKVEGVPASALAERTVDAVGEILGAIAEAAEAADDLKSLAANYAAEYAPVLRAAISGTEAIASAFTSASGSTPRWKTILMAIAGLLKVCMSSKAVSAAVPESVATVLESPEVIISSVVETAHSTVVAAAQGAASAAQNAVEDAVETAQNAVADAQAAAADAVPSVEELVQDTRLVVDAKAPPAPHAPTPPPTPDQTQESTAE